MSSMPRFVGSHTRGTPTQLAEAAIDVIDAMTPKSGPRANALFEVGLDIAGRVFVDHPGTTTTRELVMVCNRRSDPDALADAIREELAVRNPAPKRRVVGRPHGRREAA